jgi:H+/gluconate symporter-like permease
VVIVGAMRPSTAFLLKGRSTLPHNGAVITHLAVTGFTHKTSCRDILSITCIKVIALFVVLGVYYLFGIA